MDIWVMASPENAGNGVEVLKAFGAPQPESFYEALLLKKRAIGMELPPCKIEVVTSIDGASFHDCHANRLLVEMDGTSVPCLSLRDLRKNKLASGGHKDVNDLEHLPEA